MQDFVAGISPFRMLLIILGGLLFVLLGFWMIGAFGEPPSPTRYGPETVTMIGWVSIILFGFCALIGARRLIQGGDQLRVSARGIYSKPWSSQTIPWSEIAEVSVWEYRRQKMIILKLKDASRYPSETFMGKLAGANRVLTGGDIAISLTGTDKSFDEAMAAIEQFRK